jgi:hypothetical protein
MKSSTTLRNGREYLYLLSFAACHRKVHDAPISRMPVDQGALRFRQFGNCPRLPRISITISNVFSQLAANKKDKIHFSELPVLLPGCNCRNMGQKFCTELQQDANNMLDRSKDIRHSWTRKDIVEVPCLNRAMKRSRRPKSRIVRTERHIKSG